MSKVSKVYAWGEIRDHRKIYTLIIIIIALTMSSFMMIHATILYTSQVISSTTKMALSSDVCILAPGSDERDLYGGAVEIPNAGELERTINELQGYTASVRCVLQGSYNVGDGFDACVIQGIDLKRDVELEKIKSSMAQGEWFDETKSYLRHRTGIKIDLGNLTSKIKIGDKSIGRISFELGNPGEEPYPVIIGETATKVHPIKVGDIVPMIGTKGSRGDVSSSVVTIQLKVIGTYRSGTPTLDQMIWFMPIDCLREIKGYGSFTDMPSQKPLSLPQLADTIGSLFQSLPFLSKIQLYNITLSDIGSSLEGISEGLILADADFEVDNGTGEVILIKVPKPISYMNEVAHSKKVVKMLRAELDGSKDYAIFSSHDLIRYLSGSMQDIASIMHWIMMFIILALAAFAIYHAMDNIVLRKIREIGTLKAFGATDGAILEIFLDQALFIGLLSGGFAVGISIIAMKFINWYGGLSIGFIGETQLDIKFLVTPSIILITFALPILVSILASILPAKKAARLSPVEALKKGEISL